MSKIGSNDDNCSLGKVIAKECDSKYKFCLKYIGIIDQGYYIYIILK